jgi:hypothetical protein
MAHEKGPFNSSEIRLNFTTSKQKTATNQGTSPLSVGLKNADTQWSAQWAVLVHEGDAVCVFGT